MRAVCISIPLLEGRQREQALQNRRHVAAVAQVANTSKSRPKDRLEHLSILACHVKVEFEVLLDLELSHALLGFGEVHHVDAKVRKVLGQVGVDTSVVACVAVDVSTAFCRDSALLDGDRVASLFEMGETVTVASHAAKLSSTASKMSAGDTEPEVGSEVTFAARSEVGKLKLGWLAWLDELAGVVA